MFYSIIDLIIYFFLYSFMGWCVQAVYVSLKEHRFVNKGILNLPLCPTYGIIMDIMILTTADMSKTLPIQFLICYIMTAAVLYLSGTITERFMHRPLWDYASVSGFSWRLKGLGISLVSAVSFYMILCVVHPIILLLTRLIPVSVQAWIDLILVLLLIADILILYYFSRKSDCRNSEQLTSARNTSSLGASISAHIWRRLHKAYPMLAGSNESVKESDAEVQREGVIFAKGMCLAKVIWVFLITALLGDIIETFYCRLVGGTWMRRSSLVFGPFSVVWGLGAAIMTVLLYRLIDKEDRYIFLGGFFFGGAFEYMCSVVLEAMFGMLFWDYSYMYLNIGGRTNVLFMFFWGFLALIWLKVIYPRLNAIIEKIPPVSGTVLTWVLVVLMACDMLVTSAIMYRATDRHKNPEPSNIIEEYADYFYPEEVVKAMWPNMNFIE